MNRIRTLLALCLLAGTAGAAGAQSGVFVITSDFATGSTAYLAPAATAAEINLLGVHADAVGHYQHGRLYIVNRLGQDNVTVLDPADLRTPLTQFSVGNGTNPHDIEILADDRAYVSRYDDDALLIVDPRDGSELGSIDLSELADADGLPEMSQIVRAGAFVYVACQRLDRDGGFAPLDARLAVIDPATDALVDVIPLAATNPNSVIAVGDARLVVAGSAGFGDLAGGIEVIELDGLGGGSSGGLILTEADLGGDLSRLALHTADAGFAVVIDASFANGLVPVDLANRRVGGALDGLSGGFLPSIAVDGHRLLVADQGSISDPGGAGLKVFDTASGALLAGPFDTGLPPADIVVLTETRLTAVVADATAAAVPDAIVLEAGYPNPFNASVRIPFSVPVDGAATLTVHDAVGRLVRHLHDGHLATGRYAATWDGLDDAGRRAGNGLYLVRLRAGAATTASKITLLK